jgi:hypothetical protein
MKKPVFTGLPVVEHLIITAISFVSSRLIIPHADKIRQMIRGRGKVVTAGWAQPRPFPRLPSKTTQAGRFLRFSARPATDRTCKQCTTGPSLLLPCLFLLAACFWWIWFTLSRLTLLDRRRPQLPATEGRLEPIDNEPNKKILEIAQPCACSWRVYTLPLAIMAVGLATTVGSGRVSHPVYGPEGKWFDRANGLLFGLVLFAIAESLMRMIVVWLECGSGASNVFRSRILLIKLKGFSWSPIWQLTAGKLDSYYLMISRRLEWIHHLGGTESLGEDCCGRSRMW